MSIERTASCSCGALRALCRGEPDRVSVCHCGACKRRTGSAFSCNATFRDDQVDLLGPRQVYRRLSEAGRWAAYSFCPTCASVVAYRLETRPSYVSVPVGGFADETFPEPTVSCFEARRPAWVQLQTAGPLTEE